jgi:hypothetical protein
MTCVEPQRMRMTRSFNHYTDGIRVYLSRKLKYFFLDVEVFDLTPSLASQLLQGTAFNL